MICSRCYALKCPFGGDHPQSGECELSPRTMAWMIAERVGDVAMELSRIQTLIRRLEKRIEEVGAQ